VGIGIDEDQLIAPKGLDSAKFDIVAKIPEDKKSGPGQLQIMMQSLLADRFNLRIHRKTRELSSYTLVTDKSGNKVHFVDIGEASGNTRSA